MGVAADGIGAGGGQELERTEYHEVKSHEFLDGGEGIGCAVRPGRNRGRVRPARGAARGRGEIPGPEVIGQAAEQIFHGGEKRLDADPGRVQAKGEYWKYGQDARATLQPVEV